MPDSMSVCRAGEDNVLLVLIQFKPYTGNQAGINDREGSVDKIPIWLKFYKISDFNSLQ